jgi:hypothetical protein
MYNSDVSCALAMYRPCNKSQYIIEVLGCVARCIGMYWDVLCEAFGFKNRMVIHHNTSLDTSQYIVKIHQNSSQYIHDVIGC